MRGGFLEFSHRVLLPWIGRFSLLEGESTLSGHWIVHYRHSPFSLNICVVTKKVNPSGPGS